MSICGGRVLAVSVGYENQSVSEHTIMERCEYTSREVVQYLHAVVAKASLRCEIRLLGTIVVEPQVCGHLIS